MLYFAYGSNMDPVQMRDRAPGARARGPARLAGYRLTFTRDSPGWGGGVGHVEPSPGDEVWGVLWEITDADLASLDEYEGVSVGAYVRRAMMVRHGDVEVEAVAYLAVPRGYKPPSKRYVRALVRGAEAHGLPAAYVQHLRALAPSRPSDAQPSDA